MVKVMYNLLYYQIILQLCVTLTDLECDYIISKYSINHLTSEEHTSPTTERRSSTRPNPTTSYATSLSYLGSAMALLLSNTGRLSHLRRDSIPSTSAAAAAASSSTGRSAGSVEVNLKSMELQLQTLCLPYLRIAALLRQHLYRHEMPEISAPGLEFVRLIYYLELVTDSMDWDCFNASKGLCFITGTEQTLPQFWCEQLMDIQPPFDAVKEPVFINQHSAWQQPKLLQLPREYERLFTVRDEIIMKQTNVLTSICFQYYHERPCLNCYKVPKESSICLLCGTIVCLKQNCCAENDCCEAVRVCYVEKHSIIKF